MALANHPNLLGRGAVAPSGSSGIVGGPSSSTDNALVRWNGTTGKIIKNGVVTEANDTGTLTGPVSSATTTAVGIGFTNQPANDGVEAVSDNAADTTQVLTVIGTTNGGNVVVVENVTLNGTTVVSTVKTDWGVILAVKLSAVAAGTVTVREASADQTITTLTTGQLSRGVTTVSAANQPAYNRTVSALASGSTTKQIGFKGTDNTDAVIYDSKPLNGTTAITSNSTFRTITEIYRGDLEATRTATVTTNGVWVLTSGSLSIGGNILAAGLAVNGTGAIQFPAGAADKTSGLSFSDSNMFLFAEATTRMVMLSGGATSTFVMDSTGAAAAVGMIFRSNGTAKWDLGFQVSGSASGAYEIFNRTTGANAMAFAAADSGLTLAGKLASYNGIATAGNGAITVQGAGRVTAQIAAAAGVATYTVGAADASFLVSANVNVTTATAHTFTATCTYTDETNTSRTLTLTFSQITGTFLTAITNVTGAGAYEGIPLHIRAKAATSITVATVGTFTTVTYNVEGVISKLQ